MPGQSFSVRILPYRSENNRIDGVVVTFADVSLARSLESGIRSENDLWRILLDAVSEGVILQDFDGNVTFTNHSASEILGISAAALKDLPLSDPRWQTVRADESPLPPEKHPTVNAAATGLSVDSQLLGIVNPRSGARMWLRLSVSVVRSAIELGPRHVLTIFQKENRAREGERRAEA